MDDGKHQKAAKTESDSVSSRRAPKCDDGPPTASVHEPPRDEQTGGQADTDDVWFLRYKEQCEANAATEDRIKVLEENVAKLRESSTTAHTGTMKDLSEREMKLLLKKTERQVLALKGELKDYEWRLDQESAAHYRALAEKRDLALQLSRINGTRDDSKLKWEPIHKRRSLPKVTKEVDKT